MAVFLGPRRMGTGGRRPNWPGLRPQTSGNGGGGQDGGCECTKVGGGWPRNPLLPVLGALGGDCRRKPLLIHAAAAGGGAVCAGLALRFRVVGGTGRDGDPRCASSGLIFPGGGWSGLLGGGLAGAGDPGAGI